MDVAGLYPALTNTWVRKILKTTLMRTEVTVAGIDWQVVGVYLASTHTQQELDEAGLGEVVPRWCYRPQGGGNRPGITSDRALHGRPAEREQVEEKSWLEPERQPTEDEKKMMLTLAVIAGVMGSMSNHCYRLPRETRCQSDGGSIGDRGGGGCGDGLVDWGVPPTGSQCHQ